MFDWTKWIACLLIFWQLAFGLGSKPEVQFSLTKSNHSDKTRTLLTAQVEVAFCADNVENSTADQICRSMNYQEGRVIPANHTAGDQPNILLSLVCPNDTWSNCPDFQVEVISPGDCETGAAHLQCTPPQPLDCPAGTRWDNTTRTCARCGADTYSPGGHVTECIPCPPGMRAEAESDACELRCKFRQHWNKRMSRCVDTCPGHHKYGDGLECQPCPPDGTICTVYNGTVALRPLDKYDHWTRVLLGGAGGALLCAIIAIIILYFNRDGQCIRGCDGALCVALKSPIGKYRQLKESGNECDQGARSVEPSAASSSSGTVCADSGV
ncbi:hypothetical protein ACHWQZ_G012352 [Mnemiopsis leidyi]